MITDFIKLLGILRTNTILRNWKGNVCIWQSGMEIARNLVASTEGLAWIRLEAVHAYWQMMRHEAKALGIYQQFKTIIK